LFALDDPTGTDALGYSFHSNGAAHAPASPTRRGTLPKAALAMRPMRLKIKPPCAAPPHDQLSRCGGSEWHRDQPCSKTPSW
jgi:hypothetical protein